MVVSRYSNQGERYIVGKPMTSPYYDTLRKMKYIDRRIEAEQEADAKRREAEQEADAKRREAEQEADAKRCEAEQEAD